MIVHKAAQALMELLNTSVMLVTITLTAMVTLAKKSMNVSSCLVTMILLVPILLVLIAVFATMATVLLPVVVPVILFAMILMNTMMHSHNCSVNSACTNNSGGFSCMCKNGCNTNGVKCLDNDECGLEFCSDDAMCNNTEGSFSCS